MEGLRVKDLLYWGLLLWGFIDDVNQVACPDGLADTFQPALHDMEELFFEWVATCFGSQYD